MRHHKNDCRLNRNSSHRHAMFRNMVNSLICHEIIMTTLSKSKELRRIIEPMITLAKVNSIAHRRLIFSFVRDNKVVAKLFNELSSRFVDRSGGYTRILKCGFRTGDNTPMAYIELINHSKSKNVSVRK